MRAELKRCSNLNKGIIFRRLIEPDNVLRRDSNGNILVTLSPTIEVKEHVICSGEAQARGGACGININAKAKEMGAGALVRRIDASISATLERGSSGKMCLKVQSVKGRIRKEDVQWAGFKMKFAGLPIGIPGSLINAISRKLPLEKPINKLVNTLTRTLKEELDKMNLCM